MHNLLIHAQSQTSTHRIRPPRLPPTISRRHKSSRVALSAPIPPAQKLTLLIGGVGRLGLFVRRSVLAGRRLRRSRSNTTTQTTTKPHRPLGANATRCKNRGGGSPLPPPSSAWPSTGSGRHWHCPSVQRQRQRRQSCGFGSVVVGLELGHVWMGQTIRPRVINNHAWTYRYSYISKT